MKRQSGFTLIELLVTITVASILATIAIPSFKLTFQNNRLVSQANDILGAMIYARSEAVALNQTVSVCASSDGVNCGTAWASGWIIGYAPTGTTFTTILRKHEALSGNNTLTSTLGGTVTFLSSGLSGGTGYFSLCDSRGPSFGRSLYLSANGFARLSTTSGKQIDGATSMSC